MWFRLGVPALLLPELAKYLHEIKSHADVTIKFIDNNIIAKLARFAGAPRTKSAGVYLHKKLGDKVLKGETLLTVYAGNTENLDYAIKYYDQNNGYLIK